MKLDTKILKKYLIHYFPMDKFSVRYVEAKNYVDTSDKIIIKTTANYNKLYEFISKNSKGIVIYKTGSVATKTGDYKSELFKMETDVEFIEIGEMI